jgi:ribonuclease HI
MSSPKKQWYAVKRGRKPGLYTQWAGEGEAAAQVQGFAGAAYKGFATRAEAQAWLDAPSSAPLAPTNPPPAEAEAESASPQALLAAGNIVIFTDGSSLGNPGAGGYGVVLLFGAHRKELSGGFARTTNNRMEIYACLAALRALKPNSPPVYLFSDSQYVVNSIRKGWAKRWQSRGWMRTKDEPAENADLWQELLPLCETFSVQFLWVRGHNNTPENERCDVLARSAAQGKNLPQDGGFTR